MRVLTREQVRAVDRLAIERYGVPGIVLMENAARGLVEETLRFLFERWRKKFGTEAERWPVSPEEFPRGVKALIVCGGGNNGGDGFAAARHLHNHGCVCTIVLTRPPEAYAGDAKINFGVVQAMKLPIVDATNLEEIGEHDVILDGLLGTGLSEAVREAEQRVIQWMNVRHEPIVAIDIPSGLDCDRGEPLGAAVRAAMTVTFVGMKLGFTNPASRVYTGAVRVVGIGAPAEVVEQVGGTGAA